MIKEEARRILEALLVAYDNCEHGDYFYDYGSDVCEAVECLLSKSDVPVVHGRWIPCDPDSDVRFYCSQCDTEISTSWDYDQDEMWNYCPSCGAKMDAEEEPELIPILCKHASSAKKNDIGETVVYCEMCAAWQNVTLGDCYGNCECQEVDGDVE